MGIEDNRFYRESARGLTVGEIWDRQDRMQKVEEARMIENARADATAIWSLADYYIPADVREMAERWGMKRALTEMWRGAFIEGRRAAHRK
jgi:predicted N-formylglutamate amidohydrolase